MSDRIVWLVVTLLVGSPLAAQEPVAPVVQAPLMFKVLGYDHALAARAKDRVATAVVYAADQPASSQAMAAMATALEAIAKSYSVAGLPVVVLRVPFTSASDLQEVVERLRPAALYVCSGLRTADVDAIAKITREHSITSFTGTEAYLKEGLAVGLVLRGTRPAIVVNLTASRAEGANLAATLLQLVEIVR